ncbi:hypothetical protein L289_0951 [Acinetobacter gerneri DSM 14967 = CIP 107464 = MTCC 9824]|nr:hypothetical protein L289_0951 [Acinetobacter gerneri DSM 14967 = CIP 107464 = MTCC 9824]
MQQVACVIQVSWYQSVVLYAAAVAVWFDSSLFLVNRHILI